MRDAPNQFCGLRRKSLTLPPRSIMTVTIQPPRYCQILVNLGWLRPMTEKKPRILIAEDFEENRIALKLLLTHSGFDVIEAETGRQAVEAVQREKPDLILMDVTLPEIDGLQATREIRDQDEFRQIPIIIVSAHDNEEIRREATEAGGTDYISKPIEIEDLKKLIENCLSAD
jgi:CheY-like chemotaxis protein